MCCEISSPPAAGRGAQDSSGSSDAIFYAALQDGMHAMAQPLTLLQSHFYLVQAGVGGFEAQQLVADAASGVAPLCLLFRLVQELILAQSEPASPSDVELSLVLGSIEQDAEALFAGTDLRFVFLADLCTGLLHPAAGEEKLGNGVIVRTDPRRTRQAWLSMLHLVRESAAPRGVVACSVIQSETWLELRLQMEQMERTERTEPSCPESPLFKAGQREMSQLYRALATIHMLRQQGLFLESASPWRLSIKMPLGAPPSDRSRNAGIRPSHSKVIPAYEMRGDSHSIGLHRA